MTNLSPAAQAVYDAAMNTPEEMPYEHDIAAALRAVAEQVVPQEDDVIREKILNIAAELEQS